MRFSLPRHAMKSPCVSPSHGAHHHQSLPPRNTCFLLLCWVHKSEVGRSPPGMSCLCPGCRGIQLTAAAPSVPWRPADPAESTTSPSPSPEAPVAQQPAQGTNAAAAGGGAGREPDQAPEPDQDAAGPSSPSGSQLAEGLRGDALPHRSNRRGAHAWQLRLIPQNALDGIPDRCGARMHACMHGHISVPLPSSLAEAHRSAWILFCGKTEVPGASHTAARNLGQSCNSMRAGFPQGYATPGACPIHLPALGGERPVSSSMICRPLAAGWSCEAHSSPGAADPRPLQTPAANGLLPRQDDAGPQLNGLDERHPGLMSDPGPLSDISTGAGELPSGVATPLQCRLHAAFMGHRSLLCTPGPLMRHRIGHSLRI